MKRLFIGCIAMLGMLTPALYAAEAPKDLRTLEVSDTTILLDWEDVEGAIGYYLYYGTKSASGGTYDTEGINLIDESEFLVEELDANTDYYLAITSVDEFGTESSHSQELEQKTLAQWSVAEAVNFRIKGVEVIAPETLSFEFSGELETGAAAVREFIIEEKIAGTDLAVDISDIDPTDPKKVIVVLSWEMKPVTQYKVTVLDIRDADGNTIESWVDAFISFTTPAVLDEEEPEEETPAPEVTPEEETTENTNTEEEVELEAAGPEQETVEVNEGNAGTNISTDELSQNTSMTAESNEKLPQTGPEHILLILMALLLSGWVYLMSHTKKQS